MTEHTNDTPDAVHSSSTHDPEPNGRKGDPEEGTALSLSGGGYRAMVFHLGVLIRLNEIGRLRTIKRISSVSGGSITAGALGAAWGELSFGDGDVADNLVEKVIDPVCRLASRTIDVKAIACGALWNAVGKNIQRAYDKHLFKGKSLQDLPTDQAGPRFVINATNVQTGVLWRFSRPYMADYLVGQIMNPDVPLAQAVAASSAFPPLLSPVILKVNPEEFEPSTLGPFGEKGGAFTRRIVLTDGGVYDNLGLETAFKRYRTLLVSNAGGQMTGRPRPRRNWLSHTYRIFNIVDNQVRSLRKRQLLDSYTTEATSRKRLGAYWSIRSNIADYGLQDTLPCPQSDALRLAATPTRLKKLDESLQRQLINWGYAICDAAIRRYWDPEGSISPPDKFPYAGGIDGK